MFPPHYSLSLSAHHDTLTDNENDLTPRHERGNPLDKDRLEGGEEVSKKLKVL